MGKVGLVWIESPAIAQFDSSILRHVQDVSALCTFGLLLGPPAAQGHYTGNTQHFLTW